MRYNSEEITALVGEFSTGDSVTIQVIDIVNDEVLTLADNVCEELGNCPGMFKWTTDKMPAGVEGHMLYRMNNGSKNYYGKFTMGGHLDEMKESLQLLTSAQMGSWHIKNDNHMYMYDEEGETIAKFALYDITGTPTMHSVFKRDRVD